MDKMATFLLVSIKCVTGKIETQTILLSRVLKIKRKKQSLFLASILLFTSSNQSYLCLTHVSFNYCFLLPSLRYMKIINVAVYLVVMLLLQFSLVILLLCICHPISICNICKWSILFKSFIQNKFIWLLSQEDKHCLNLVASFLLKCFKLKSESCLQ